MVGAVVIASFPPPFVELVSKLAADLMLRCAVTCRSGSGDQMKDFYLDPHLRSTVLW